MNVVNTLKILCFIDSLGSGGAQRQLVELGKGFKARGHEVLFLTYHDITFFKPDLEAAHIPVKTVIERNYLKRIFKIRKAIRHEKPDAVLSFLEPANFMATLAGFPYRNWKLVVGERSANPMIYKSIKKIVFRWFHLLADHIVANSQANLKMVKKISPFLNSNKCHTIYNIVNVPSLNVNKNSSTLKTKIVIAASYRKIKNTQNLIKAVSKLPVELKNKLEIEWYGAANTDYYTAMLNLVEEKNLKEVIKLNDTTSRIYEKYSAADFVGLFSLHEGFPNTICEAMALGKPVVVSKVSDIPIFVKDEINGFLCDGKDINSIEKSLIKTIQTNEFTKSKMGKINSEIAHKNFNKSAIIEAYLQLLTNHE